MPIPRLARSREDAEAFIAAQKEQGNEILRAAANVGDDESYRRWTHDVERWDAYTADGLRATYQNEEPAQEFHDAATGGLMRNLSQTAADTFQYRKEAVERGIHALESLRERLDFAIPPNESPAAAPSDPTSTRDVFVVHGRDEGLRDRVARVLQTLDFRPIILGEKTWEGRTVIEKFEEQSSQVGFAVVILSADDWGRGPDDSDWPAEPNRARQNVILELGYFMGRLGRRYVAPLLGPGVERPSDIDGLGYINLADADWPFKLGAELAAAGYEVDLNRLT